MPDPYVKQTWVDGVAGGTPISAARLSYIEDGIQNATIEDGTFVDDGSLVWDAVHHGVTGDALLLDDVQIELGSNIVVCPTAAFTQADVGKSIAVMGAGVGGAAITQSSNPITQVDSATQCRMTKTASVGTVAARTVADGATTAGNRTLTSPGAGFSTADRAKTVTIVGAGEVDRYIVTEKGAMTATSAVLTATYACFAPSIVGKRIKVSTAGSPTGVSLVATVLTRDSATQVTLDTPATSTVTGALVQAWTIADLVTEVTGYVSDSSLEIRIPASQTTAGAAVHVGGHQGVYGTNDVPAVQALVSAVSAGDRILLREGMRVFLAQGSVTVNKAVEFIGASPARSVFELGASGTRIVAATNDVTCRDVQFHALMTNGTIDLFSATATVDNGYKNWKFLNCKFDGVRVSFQRVGSLSGAGTVNTTGSNFSGPVYLDDCEHTHVMGPAIRAEGLGTEVVITEPWIHHNGISSSDWGIKGLAGARVKVRGGIIEWNSGDGIDLFEATDGLVIGTEVRHNGGIGCSTKWRTLNGYTGGGHRHTFSNIFAWNNGGYGIQCSADRMLVSTIRAYGNRLGGVYIGSASNINLPTDPSSDCILDGIIAIGNDSYGLALIDSPLRVIVRNVEAHANTLSGVYTSSFVSLDGVRAFSNAGIGGVEVGVSATKVIIRDSQTQDSNGACFLGAGATFVSVNGYGEEAGPPTLASWPVGTVVTDTTTGIAYRRGLTAWSRPLDQSVPEALMSNNRYYVPEGGRSTAAMVSGTEYAVPFKVEMPGVTAVALGVEITVAATAGTVIRLGIRNDGGRGLPGTVVAETTVAADAVALVESAISAALPIGLYHLTAVAQNTGGTLPTVRIISNNRPGVGGGTLAETLGVAALSGGTQTGIAGALPPTWTAAGRTATPPLVAVKVSVA